MAKHLSLAARYRPQTFAQVAGQDMVKAVLSRAAAEDRPAAAYLLSGTRGVGKTTIARIFAKALNCEHAPGPEPCNECAQCRKITQGAHVDVTEIDGASNNSVEDARALRENIGYAPMEGRYKIFIIDEAHMLSRSAFNALLKTLEEPPERVVFIFATTEAHKFPVTIVSRCQHFVFRHLSEDALAEHLTHVLRKEKTSFEEGAVRLLARRAAGSVRDSMSLLDQALALGGESLTVEGTRQVLGLAGQELFSRLLDALHTQDCAAVADITGQILHQGLDIGFFVRELAGNLRNLFLLRQSGPAVLPALHLPADEAAFWQSMAPRFAVGHLHAAWQMTLEAQRGIVQSPEPAAALELLLLNLALLPRLLPVEHIPTPSLGEHKGPAPVAEHTGAAGTASQPEQHGHTPRKAMPRPAEGHDAAEPDSTYGRPPATARQRASGQQDSRQQDSRQARTADDGSKADGSSADGARSAEPEPEPAPSGMAAAEQEPEQSARGKALAAPQVGALAHRDAPEQADVAEEPPAKTQPARMPDAPERDADTTPPAQASGTRAPAASSTPADAAANTMAHAVANTASVTEDFAGTAKQSTQGQSSETEAETPPATLSEKPAGSAGTSVAQLDWQAFCAFCAAKQEAGQPAPPAHLLSRLTAYPQGGQLVLQAKAQSMLHPLEKQRALLECMLEDFGAGRPELIFTGPPPVRTETELIEEFSKKELLQPCLEVLQAHIVHCKPIK